MYVLYQFLSLVQLLIVARVILSWVASPVSRNPVVQLIRQVTDPILLPIRSILPRTGMFDLSPMVALFAIYFLQSLIAGAM
ncbi:MAG: YggT family protein [Longimicrobiaceae bacterium]